MITVFSGLALFIAALGLLGFTTYLTHRRAQEVGIRKVVGADGWDILVLFNQGVVRLVLIASLVALPLGYFGAEEWLANYATRVDLNFFYLLLPGAVLLVITLVTTTWQISKVMRTNAVDLLHND